MGRIDIKKQKKRESLMKSAYDLFTSQGFTSTTIHDIAMRAGVAKGTFYLYFNDKTDIREAVIRSTAARLLREACESLDEHMKTQDSAMEVADMFIYIIDHLIETVARDALLLRFISKHLSWGLLYSEPADPGRNRSYGDTAAKSKLSDSDAMITAGDIEGYVVGKLSEYNVRIRDLKLLLFTLLELVSSTCHDVILYHKPVPLEEYKPYLNSCIRLLVNEAIV